MTKQEMIDIAKQNDCGEIYFEFRTALNTGREMEVGYVYDKKGVKHLFCKYNRFEGFHLCNDFRKLISE